MTETPLILCDNLVKIFKVADREVMALQGLDLAVEPGETLGLVGASGSGKSTLLNILGGLDRPSAGRVVVEGQELLKLSGRALDRYRRTRVGFVWQQPGRNLIPYLSARENVELPMTVAGMGLRAKKERSRELLERVGLWERHGQRPAQLSGGEQQRVAIAVALANRPGLLLADEPTGEVDSATAQELLELFRALNRAYGLTVVIVTHDPQVARRVDRVLGIRDGKTSTEILRRSVEPATAAEKTAGETEPDYHEYVVLDSAGRLQVPREYLERLGIGDRATLQLTDEGILIRPAAGRQPAVAPLVAGLEEEPPPRPRGWRGWWAARRKR